MKRLLVVLLSVFLGQAVMFAQEISVSGNVTDVSGQGLPGVNVVIKGTTVGAVTNLDGAYNISVPSSDAVLVFSYIGFSTQEIAVGNQTSIEVTLQEDVLGLEEVVVVGYGSQKKASVVGAISTISADEIVTSPVSNLTSGLAGKMPGLTIMVKNGELGAESVQTYIRGLATTNDAAPLVLVDGVEREINTLDPYDIEGISILKDASATAVFGVRGANGVILITTKKGLIGKPQLSANMNYSTQTLTRIIEPLNAVDYMTLRNEVIEQDNLATGGATPPAFGQDVFDAYANNYLPEYYVDRNWYDEFMYKHVGMYKANLNLRGGNERTKYFTSVGYMSQGGPFKTERWEEYNYDNEQRLDRFTYRANIDMQITKTLRGWLNLSGYLQDKNDPIFHDVAASGSGSSYYYLHLAYFADCPAIDHTDLTPFGGVVARSDKNRTAYGQANRTGYKTETTNTINSTLGLEQDLGFITEGLSARGIISYDARAGHLRGFRREYQTWNPILGTDASGADSLYYVPGSGIDEELTAQLTQNFNTNFDLEASLNYNRTFGGHAVTGLILYKQNQRIVNVQVPYNYVGIVGRATYAYNNRYLAEFNFGMNGSEQFASGNRFGFFPSVSAGWVISEESFMSNQNALNYLKIRASYGQVGNDKISGSRFIYVDDWAQGNGGYGRLGNIPGLPQTVYQNSVPNPLVSWEVANKANLGFESRFLGGFELDVDLFYEKRNSILTTASLIPRYMFGQHSLPPANEGIMTNRGFETTLGYHKNVTSDLFLWGRFSTAFARNTIEKMNEAPLDETFVYPYRVEGFSRGTVWGFDCLGYFADDAEIASWADQTGLGAQILPGDLKYDDKNGDNIIDEKDKIPMPNPNVPEINLSLSFGGNFKGFDLSVLLHYVDNYTFNFSGRGIYAWGGNPYNGYRNYFEHHKYAWTEERAASAGDLGTVLGGDGPIQYPRIHIDGQSVSKQPSNYWLIDLWYLRVRNLELGYTLPNSVSSRIGMEKLRVFVNGQNVLTFDNMPYKILDPEVSNSLSHPIFATYNAGLTVTF